MNFWDLGPHKQLCCWHLSNAKKAPVFNPHWLLKLPGSTRSNRSHSVRTIKESSAFFLFIHFLPKLPSLLCTSPVLLGIFLLYIFQFIYLHFQLGFLFYKAQSLKPLCKERITSSQTILKYHNVRPGKQGVAGTGTTPSPFTQSTFLGNLILNHW